MIKVCYIIGQLVRGGAERQLYELLKGINREKFYPIVITLSQGGYWGEEIRKLNIQVIEIHRRKNRELLRLFKLIKLLKLIKPEIVHTFLFSANSYGRLASILTRVPVVFASERSLPDVGKGKTRSQIYIDKILSLFSDGIICNSFTAAEILVKKYSFIEKKVFAIHNGINDMLLTGLSDHKAPKKIARKVVGTVGRLHPVKDHKLFLDAAKIIIDSAAIDDIKFLIVGEGPLKQELEMYAEDIGITNNIILTGERKDIPELLKGMDVFVMTSLFEGLSNSIMEAMVAGLPVVATDVGGNSELVKQGETGFLCPPDSRALAEKVLIILKNNEMAYSMGQNARKIIVNEFSIDKMLCDTEDVYLRFLDKKGILQKQAFLEKDEMKDIFFHNYLPYTAEKK